MYRCTGHLVKFTKGHGNSEQLQPGPVESISSVKFFQRFYETCVASEEPVSIPVIVADIDWRTNDMCNPQALCNLTARPPIPLRKKPEPIAPADSESQALELEDGLSEGGIDSAGELSEIMEEVHGGG